MMFTEYANETVIENLSIQVLVKASMPGDDDDDKDEDGDWSDIDDEDFEDIADDMDDLHEIELDNNIFDPEDDDHLPEEDD